MPKSVAYYECAAEYYTDPSDPTGTYVRPLIDRHFYDANGNAIGRYSVLEQDSDTAPTSFLVKVINTPAPTPQNPDPTPDNTVHVECAKTGLHMGVGFNEAKAKMTARFGAGRALRLARNGDITFPGE